MIHHGVWVLKQYPTEVHRHCELHSVITDFPAIIKIANHIIYEFGHVISSNSGHINHKRICMLYFAVYFTVV